MTKKVLRISAKCSDMFWAGLYKDGGLVSEYVGYVPDFMPGEHFGDYVELDIDPETGVILNWQPTVVAQEIKSGVLKQGSGR